MAFYFFWCLGGESRGCCPGRRDALGEPGGGSDRSEAQGCSLAASTPVLGGRGGTSHVCRRQNLKPWLARGRNEAEKAEVWGWRRSAEGGVARQPRVGFFFCCRDLSGKMLRGPGAPPNPQNVARAPDVVSGVLAGALTAPRSRWIYITIIWRCRCSALGSVWRGWEPALRSESTCVIVLCAHSAVVEGAAFGGVFACQ